MATSSHFQRALALHHQGRYDMAEKEMRQHLAESPDDGVAHAGLAMSLLELDKLDEAEEASTRGIGLTPDLAFTHYVLARVLMTRTICDTSWQERGYYSIWFLVPEAPFQVNACRGDTRFHLHVDWYGRITERVAIGPCRSHWMSGDDDQDTYQWRRSYRGDDFRYRPYR